MYMVYERETKSEDHSNHYEGFTSAMPSILQASWISFPTLVESCAL